MGDRFCSHRRIFEAIRRKEGVEGGGKSRAKPERVTSFSLFFIWNNTNDKVKHFFVRIIRLAYCIRPRSNPSWKSESVTTNFVYGVHVTSLTYKKMHSRIKLPMCSYNLIVTLTLSSPTSPRHEKKPIHTREENLVENPTFHITTKKSDKIT